MNLKSSIDALFLSICNRSSIPQAFENEDFRELLDGYVDKALKLRKTSTAIYSNFERKLVRHNLMKGHVPF